MEYVIIWIIGIVIAIMIANSRKVSIATTVLISIFIPIVGIVYAIVAKPKETPEPLTKKSSSMNQKDKITELKDLKFLLDEGVLTKEEYESKKEKLYPKQEASEQTKEEDIAKVKNLNDLPNNTKTVTFKSVNGDTVTVNYNKFLKVVEYRDFDSYIILDYTTTDDN